MDLRGWGVRVVAVGALAVLLAGCGGDAEPVVTPTPTLSAPEVEAPAPTPTPTPSPSPTALPTLTEEEILAAIPEAAKQEDFFGAQTFAEFFLHLSQDIVSSHDVRLFEALSADGCVFCENSVGVVDAVLADGVSVSGGELTVTDELAQGGREDDGHWRVVFDISIDKREFFDSDANLVDSTAEQTAEATVVLQHEGSHWKVVDVAAEEITQ